MSPSPNLSRRRALQIVASALGTSILVAASARTLAARRSARWTGIVMNAPASFELYDDDQSRAEQALLRAVAEARRLEGILSLYDPHSSISRLNSAGLLDAPPPELIRLMSEANNISVATDGAFDATMQPLWRLYAEHFARHPVDTAGPPQNALANACKLVDYRNVSVAEDRIAFLRSGMAISLNGIAQGFVTDRVTDLLRAEGFATMIVDLGEPRMSGASPTGYGWPVTVADPKVHGKALRRLSVRDGAVATSQGAGTTFEASGRFHHLFDPRTGMSAAHYRSVTVVAPTATYADGLSTGLSILAPELLAAVIRSFPDVGVIAQLSNGEFLDVQA